MFPSYKTASGNLAFNCLLIQLWVYLLWLGYKTASGNLAFNIPAYNIDEDILKSNKTASGNLAFNSLLHLKRV